VTRRSTGRTSWCSCRSSLWWSRFCGGIGVAGLFVGQEEVRRYDEVVRKLKGED